MIPKNLLPAFLMFLLLGCGYQSIYSNINTQSFSINKISTSGNTNINRKILNLTKLTENKIKNSYSPNLNLTSLKLKEVMAKDKSGNVSVFKITVNIDFTLMNKNQVSKSKTFTSSFVYNNSNNKFKLSQYEKIVEDNLIEKLAEEIIIFINL